MLPNRARICDFVCSRCGLRRACRGPSDRRFLVGERFKIVSTDTLKNDGLENPRVIDFTAEISLKFGLPDLDSETPAEGNFGALNAQNHVIYTVSVRHKPLGQPNTPYFTALWGSSGEKYGPRGVDDGSSRSSSVALIK